MPRLFRHFFCAVTVPRWLLKAEAIRTAMKRLTRSRSQRREGLNESEERQSDELHSHQRVEEFEDGSEDRECSTLFNFADARQSLYNQHLINDLCTEYLLKRVHRIAAVQLIYTLPRTHVHFKSILEQLV